MSTEGGRDRSVSLLDRMLKAVRTGLLYASLLSLWTVLMNYVSHGKALHELDLTLPRVVIGYLLAVPIAWAVLGAFSPLRARWWGRMLGGSVAGAIGGLVLGVALVPSISAVQLLGLGLIFGIIWALGGLVWLRPRLDEGD